ncbi:acetolactate synthase large subunit [Mesorhizobium sp. WSM4887]|uniref:acetolactate synthase large subunit n=1 Tax=Mesorhizobium sp. WSM4887 TaxID=3038543 RepID=UPI00241622D0|nr:acetolactate synthase large subunit [Mesorhizobium sp. WSM4887]MDG4886838.1 acetolactate synthase large subunit [Mesorhizobium sp. WSM4887]
MKSAQIQSSNGAQSLVHTLIAGGIDTCFANPGTSEMHFVAALDQIAGIRCVLGLQENVVTGMADGYYRLADRPAASLLHCGPGLANGLANLHNARRARSGIVNIVGDQATWHRPYDAPLTTDTEALARSSSDWVRTTMSSADVGHDAACAIQVARRTGGGIATLILPSDASWDAGGAAAAPLPDLSPTLPDPHAMEVSARILRDHGQTTLILLGGKAMLAASQEAAWRLAQASGCGLMSEYVCARISRGRGRIPLTRVPYTLAEAQKALWKYSHVILVGSRPPIGFFGYPGQPSIHYNPETIFHVLSRPDQNPASALTDLADVMNAPKVTMPDPGPLPEETTGAPTPEGFARNLAAVMPEGSIISDESVSFGRGFYEHTFTAPPHDWLHLTGGAIGDGLPVATGAAIGAGGQRRVIGLQADGSAMYSLQSLWTQARERLPVTTVLLSNRKYKILINEYAGVGASPGPTAMNMLDLADPDLNWVKIAEGMGVEAARTDTLEGCADLMKQSFATQAPFLIELAI